MKYLSILVVAMLVTPPLCAEGAPAHKSLCTQLRAFARSVATGQTQSLEFHTVWGGDFKSVTSRTLYEKQCIDHGYQPAKVVCKFLMQHGAVEFSGNNAKSAVSCLSSATRFASSMRLDGLDVSFPFCTSNRGSNITVSCGPATKMRGMVMAITARGY